MKTRKLQALGLAILMVVNVGCAKNADGGSSKKEKAKEENVQEVIIKLSDFGIENIESKCYTQPRYKQGENSLSVVLDYFENYMVDVRLENDAENDKDHLLEYYSYWQGGKYYEQLKIKPDKEIEPREKNQTERAFFEIGEKIHFIVDNSSYDPYDNTEDFEKRDLNDPYDFGFLTVTTNEGKKVTAHFKLEKDNEFIFPETEMYKNVIENENAKQEKQKAKDGN